VDRQLFALLSPEHEPLRIRTSKLPSKFGLTPRVQSLPQAAASGSLGEWELECEQNRSHIPHSDSNNRASTQHIYAIIVNDTYRDSTTGWNFRARGVHGDSRRLGGQVTSSGSLLQASLRAGPGRYGGLLRHLIKGTRWWMSCITSARNAYFFASIGPVKCHRRVDAAAKESLSLLRMNSGIGPSRLCTNRVCSFRNEIAWKPSRIFWHRSYR
jgi:hypothetical protein